MTRTDREGIFGDDKVERVDGILHAESGGEVGCEGDCAPDDYVEDPINDDGVPGTVDDLPYDYGVETAPAADQMLGLIERPGGPWGVGTTGPADEGDEPDLGGPEERELWRAQRPLIEEADVEERHFPGLEEEDVSAVADASSEDSAEALPDSPEGTSATGSAHGG